MRSFERCAASGRKSAVDEDTRPIMPDGFSRCRAGAAGKRLGFLSDRALRLPVTSHPAGHKTDCRGERVWL